jgi:Polysaccharide biosynthesis enzyme WcbI
VTGRRQHHAHFYGLLPLPRDERPLLVVHGNCQAESLRVLLDGDASPVRTVRVPPVHELTAEDLPHLDRLLAEVDVLVSQPVRDGYRGLPVGTAEVLARAGRRPVSVVVPIVRWAALHPFQVIVRTPAGDPPLVPYSDLRTLALAAGRPALPDVPSPDAVLAVRALSVRELRSREERHGTVGVVDLLDAAGAAAAHTVNHPGNGVLTGLARRVLEAAGSPAEPADPGRTLLDSVHAPVLPAVLDALELTGEAQDDWVVSGARIPDATVREAQLRWYAEHPGVAEAGLDRHAEAAAALAS